MMIDDHPSAGPPRVGKGIRRGVSRQKAKTAVDPAEASAPVAEPPQGGAEEAAPMPTSTPDASIKAAILLWLRKGRDWLKAFWLSVWMGLRRLPAWGQGVLALAVLVVGAILIFLAQPNWDWARPTVASMASGRLHRPVRIDGHLRVHVFSFTPSATISGLKIGQPDWARASTQGKNLAEIDTIAVTAELMPIFIGRLVLPRLQIDRPTVLMFQDKDGRANWDFSDGADKAKPTKLPPIKNFIINDGNLTITSLQRGLTFTGSVYAHERAGSGRQAFGLTGGGSLNDRVFQMDATGGPLLNVRTSVPYPFDMNVRAGDTELTAKGRVIHPFNLGQVDGVVSVKGGNLADLYYLTGLTLPDTPAYRVIARVTRNDRVYTIDRIKGRIGGSDLEGALKVDTRNEGRPYLTGDLRSRLLDIKDLGSLFGATAANRPQRPELAVSPQATKGRRLLPDAKLDIERVRGMDAKVHYRAMSVKAIRNMPLRQVSLGINLDHGLLVLDPIDFSFPQGRLQGTARIDARTATQKNSVDMKLTGARLQDFIPKVGGSEPLEGVLNARLRATGTGNSVHMAASTANGDFTLVVPGGKIRQSLAELMGVNATKGLFLLLSKDRHETDVRCALADFQIANGVMQAQNIVFDTDVVRVDGRGSVNLNDESMKLILKGKPKKFRLVRINAPIVIGGHMSAPKFGIDPNSALAQGGLAVAFNTVLPFINIDYAKDANCAAVMAEAKAQGAPTATHAPVAKAIPARRH
ncbi:AsmA family protein [Asticcacaulis sp. 201]|uniref:AsmA family protein n=1 Tax=Asticcacaulis sp. 201 TaxID=3028787 RepID=UPI002916024B|nr:AsmA family protein [Asticcacaulis sp. 201]MDV6331836.1 AsmA family protein [Asticcacaulis sp. 201]